MDDTRDIKTLSDETGVPVRTIRYYLAEGLLPPPFGRGGGASYGVGHRDRLRLIRRLQDAHQPLAAIRRQLEALDDAGVAAALAEVAPGVAESDSTDPASAYDYVRRVLAEGHSGRAGDGPARSATAVPPSPGPGGGVGGSAGAARGSAAPPAPAPAPPITSTPAPTRTSGHPTRSTWERITLTPELELHVRRPLSRADQRRLEALLETARQLFPSAADPD